MNLTKEYFDKALKGLATKADLKKFATKDELNERFEKQTQVLIAFADAQTDALARIIKETIDEPMQQRFDALEKSLESDRKRIATVETKVQRIEEALHLTL